jgi:hypothetical protein
MSQSGKKNGLPGMRKGRLAATAKEAPSQNWNRLVMRGTFLMGDGAAAAPKAAPWAGGRAHPGINAELR